jgi:peptide-methionine (R)-S-oxide reductase
MTMRRWIRSLTALTLMAGLAVAFCSQGLAPLAARGGDDPKNTEGKAEGSEEKPKYEKPSKAELKKMLNKMQFKVTQSEGTEPPFENEYWNNHEDGVYYCIVCDQPLFDAKTKFESGTGWPSFFQPIIEEMVGTKSDYKMLYERTECHCSRCEAHLGHVFPDGPQPTGLRYCMNSASMKFRLREEADALAKANESSESSEGDGEPLKKDDDAAKASEKSDEATSK